MAVCCRALRSWPGCAWVVAVCLSGLLAAPAASANPLSDAWNCAAGVVQANYELATKGAKAAEVLGTAPQCVALALAPDPNTLVISGTLFAINAVSPSTLPANGCKPALQTTALIPLSGALDAVMPGVIPSSLKNATSDEAKKQLWTAMATTPPMSAVIGAADCGCTFLEAGISVQSLKEMLQTIGSAGAKCDKFLDNIPGYEAAKTVITSAGTALNNAGEDLFTDQVGHMSTDDYFKQYFSGYPNSYSVYSHAAARAIDASHDYANQRGAAYQSDIYFPKNPTSGGDASGNMRRSECVAYFDSHKMSNSNAKKTCDTLIKQFSTWYLQFVPPLVTRDQFYRALVPAVLITKDKGVVWCKSNLADNSNIQIQCLNELNTLAGGTSYANPYEQVTGSLGNKVDPEAVKAMIASSNTYYFREPQTTGAMAAGYKAFNGNGMNIQQAVAVTRASVAAGVDDIIAKYKKRDADEKNAVLVAQKAAFDNAVGKAWAPKCPSSPANLKAACIDELHNALDVCMAALGKVKHINEIEQDPVQLAAVKDKCELSYQAVTLNFTLYTNNYKNFDGPFGVISRSSCPAAAAAKKQCNEDADTSRATCLGGFPQVDITFYQTGKTFASPTALQDCKGVAAVFNGKWNADDMLVNNVTAALPAVLQACSANGLPGCSAQANDTAAVCRQKITQEADTKVAPIAIDSSSLQPAISAMQANAQVCLDSLVKVPQKFTKGKETEALVLATYGKQCPGRTAQGDIGALCEEELLGAIDRCLHPPMAAQGPGNAATPAGTGVMPQNLNPGIAGSAASQLGGFSPSAQPIPGGGANAAAGAPMITPEQKMEACKPQLQAVVNKYKKLAESPAERKAHEERVARTGLVMPVLATPHSGNERSAPAQDARVLPGAGRQGLPALPGMAIPPVTGAPARTGLPTLPGNLPPTVGNLPNANVPAAPQRPPAPSTGGADADATLKAAGCTPAGLARGGAMRYSCPAGAMAQCEQLNAQPASKVGACTLLGR